MPLPKYQEGLPEFLEPYKKDTVWVGREVGKVYIWKNGVFFKPHNGKEKRRIKNEFLFVWDGIGRTTTVFVRKGCKYPKERPIENCQPAGCFHPDIESFLAPPPKRTRHANLP